LATSIFCIIMTFTRHLFFSAALFMAAFSFGTVQAGNSAVSSISTPSAQDDPCSKTGPDEQESKVKFSLYREFFKQDNFVDALPHWRYVFAQAPGLSKNTFINGVKLYTDLADAATDTTVKQAYVDTLVMIYRKRIECYGEAERVTGLLAYDMYKYRPNRIEYMYGMFSEALDAAGEGVEFYLLFPYFQYTKLLWSTQEISDDDLMAAYDKLQTLCQAGIARAEAASDTKEADNWRATAAKIDEKLPRSLLTCEKLVARFESDRERLFGNLDELKKAYNGMKLAPPDSASGSRCTEQPIFAEILKQIVELEPSGFLLSELAETMWAQGNRDEALSAWSKAIDLEEDSDRRAQIALTIARVYQRDRQFVRSRDWARKAIGIRSNWGEPYILIGDLYASSASLCEGMDAELLALAALDKYQQAKSVDAGVASEANERIAKYSNYMPTKTYLFERNLNEGESYTFECWVGETTVLRGRKSN
jgi:hypothetical protein